MSVPTKFAGSEGTDSSMMSSRAAEAIAAQYYGLSCRATPIPSEVDAIARLDFDNGEAGLLRVVAKDDIGLSLQVEILRHLERDNPSLPVARVIAAAGFGDVVACQMRSGPARNALLTSFLAGRPSISTPTAHVRIASLLATLDRSLAKINPPSARRDILWNVAEAGKVRPLLVAAEDDALRALAEQALDRWEDRVRPLLPQLRHQLIHNDFNRSNILVAPAGEITGIIDFGDAIHAPLICDLATAIAYQMSDGDGVAVLEQMVASYDRILPLAGEELEVLPSLILARLAMIVVITEWRAQNNPSNRQYLQRNSEAAARGLIWLSEVPEDAVRAALRQAVGNRES